MILISALLGASTMVHAGESGYRNSADTPVPSPFDNRIVTFTYSQDVVFTLLTQAGVATHIRLDAGEGVTEKRRWVTQCNGVSAVVHGTSS
ncbi:hypothetical protein AWV80_10485 [Cupriavidus sp. UYMU48A]|nr:hypothetical protein AWV80_10485 [Cupriavidus sp. UYMU48A]